VRKGAAYFAKGTAHRAGGYGSEKRKVKPPLCNRKRNEPVFMCTTIRPGGCPPSNKPTGKTVKGGGISGRTNSLEKEVHRRRGRLVSWVDRELGRRHTGTLSLLGQSSTKREMRRQEVEKEKGGPYDPPLAVVGILTERKTKTLYSG